MKWLFIALVIINLAVYGVSQLETPPSSIELTQREKNASAVKVVTGQLGQATAAHIASEPQVASAPQATPTPTPIPTASATPTSKPTPTPVADIGRCWRWAGITGDQIDNVRTKIQNLSLIASETASGESSKVWVYMPPLASLEIAKQKAAQLAEMGITDYFVVNNGGRWQNSISLGVFSNREAGERHLAELKALGVKSAVVREKDDTLKQASFSFKSLNPQQSDKLAKLSAQFSGSVLRENKCK
ncbi:SPOR domain-containing protein [uncultured Deefgea sp.]|uniref:SPOR domain-containing protein n=1 Tax=uncultured Deefgea sp. TaxID=1304914 RepID=UPI00259169E0|nr:SPOR domain-containing protein [uncultured Deefgea sp.]